MGQDGGVPATTGLGRVAGATVRSTAAVARGGAKSGRWLVRNMLTFRRRAAINESGMMRLLDLHAASCAGDTLVTMGLAGTIFFSVPAGEARGRVALYLLMTMVPFALLAPIVGPLLDHFRHGRRYALAVTMFGRAVLAWLISDYLDNFGLFPAAFGVLVLSRSYGVARSAAVPRLLPRGLGLSEAGARASVFGTVAGLLVVPIGLLAFQIGREWPLRTAAAIFIFGGVAALRLPPRTDSDPPERVPRLLSSLFTLRFGRSAGGDRILAGRLVVASLIGGAGLRALYGFLVVFLAFTIKSGDMPDQLLGTALGRGTAIGLMAAALGAGTLLATAIGSNLRVRRPSALQAVSLGMVGALAVLCAVRFTLLTAGLFCLGTALSAALAKFALDASIQERISERMRASAFAHSETALNLSWAAGGALGLIPISGRLGVTILAAACLLGAARGGLVAWVLRADKLSGVYRADAVATTGERAPAGSRSLDQPAIAGPAHHTPASERAAAGAGPPAEPSRGVSQRSVVPAPPPGYARVAPSQAPPRPATEASDLAPPGYHIYRPSSLPEEDR
jgi:MFS family permease